MMQPEYDNVMMGRLASMFKTDGLNAEQASSATSIREQGVKEEPVPEELAAAMRAYSDQLFRKGVKPETIKRKVCEKFNITIIPE